MNSTAHLVDEELLPILELAPNMGVSTVALHQARAAIAEMTAQGLSMADPSVTTSEHLAPGHGGGPDVRVLLYRPQGLPDPAPLVLQIHGGGFVFGTAELGDPRNRAMAKAVGCMVASVDYRLAPENPFPAGLDDCYAALAWLRGNAATFGIDVGRIAIRGESAGGGIAAGLAIMARDLGGPSICFQLLVYPMLDDRTVTREPHPYAGEFVWDAASNRFGWECWLGCEPGSAGVPPLAAPARVDDLSCLPPTFIGTAALDMFVEENLEYTRRLLRAGVPTEFYLAPGAFHGFEAMNPEASVSRRLIEQGDAALRRAFDG
jgi:triacylglycerol lipase